MDIWIIFPKSMVDKDCNSSSWGLLLLGRFKNPKSKYFVSIKPVSEHWSSDRKLYKENKTDRKIVNLNILLIQRLTEVQIPDFRGPSGRTGVPNKELVFYNKATKASFTNYSLLRYIFLVETSWMMAISWSFSFISLTIMCMICAKKCYKILRIILKIIGQVSFYSIVNHE